MDGPWWSPEIRPPMTSLRLLRQGRRSTAGVDSAGLMDRCRCNWPATLQTAAINITSKTHKVLAVRFVQNGGIGQPFMSSGGTIRALVAARSLNELRYVTMNVFETLGVKIDHVPGLVLADLDVFPEVGWQS
jgi:hypothetical protein